MYKKQFVVLAIAGTLAIAGCARQPEPVRPEPVFNKFGDIVGGCIPSNRVPQSTFEASLPPCEDDCPDGTYPAGTNYEVCIPYDDGDNGRQRNGDQQTGANT